MFRKITVAVLSIFSTLFFCGYAQALIDGSDVYGMDFRFNNPGAKANGMGGAFIGLADDATAAYTNPAGLTNLTRQKIYAEFKGGEYTNRITDWTGTNDYDNTTADFSFLSFTHPTENSVISLFRHQLLNMESDFSWHQWDGQVPQEPQRRNDIEMSLEVATIGIGLGTKITNSFSFGLAVGFAEMEYSSIENRSNVTQDVGPGLIEPVGPTGRGVTTGSDTDEHLIISFLWNIRDDLDMGMVYRRGPEFKINKTNWLAVPWFPADPWTIAYDDDGVFKVPDVYGIGWSYRFELNLTLALDVSYIEYSDLVDEFISDHVSANPLTQRNGFEIDDEFEYRLGLEYKLDLAGTPLALRAGYYYRPYHRIYYTGPIASWPPGQYQQKGDDDHIGSVGIGLPLASKIQMDLGASVGTFTTEGFISMAYLLK